MTMKKKERLQIHQEEVHPEICHRLARRIFDHRFEEEEEVLVHLADLHGLAVLLVAVEAITTDQDINIEAVSLDEEVACRRHNNNNVGLDRPEKDSKDMNVVSPLLLPVEVD